MNKIVKTETLSKILARYIRRAGLFACVSSAAGWNYH